MSTIHRTGVRIHIRRSRVARGKWYASITVVLPDRRHDGRLTRKLAGRAVVGVSPADVYRKLTEGA